MKTTESTGGQFEITSISSFATQNQLTRDSAIDTYQCAFADEPYNEAFTKADAEAALEYILERGGDLLLGKLGGEVVSLAGGYGKPDGVYYVEELAVTPDKQGYGYGGTTLNALINTAKQRNPSRYEIRTTTKNDKAIDLYESRGFVPEYGLEVVAGLRQDGEIELDERVYLSAPPLPDKERLKTLKRAAIAYPSGNTTAVIFDQLLNSNRKVLNDDVMNTWKTKNPNKPEIEQCCFVTLPRNPEAVARVEMFGGEFCGNATRSAIWLITKGQDYKGKIEVSGVEKLLVFSVTDGNVSVEMPLPKDTTLVQAVAEGYLVQLDGISQLVVTNSKNKQTPRQLLADLLNTNKYNLLDKPAVGVSYYDQTSGKAEFCVWVKELGTIFDETACGSGTSAIGAALATEMERSVDLNVVQPSGEAIRTEAIYAGDGVAESSITGKVDILYDGEYKLA